ncbi:MAG TPA: hypothetical protein VGF45_11435, partial [Polyangia bacterium]
MGSTASDRVEYLAGVTRGFDTEEATEPLAADQPEPNGLGWLPESPVTGDGTLVERLAGLLGSDTGRVDRERTSGLCAGLEAVAGLDQRRDKCVSCPLSGAQDTREIIVTRQQRPA